VGVYVVSAALHSSTEPASLFLFLFGYVTERVALSGPKLTPIDK